jgi:hypothetical protein
MKNEWKIVFKVKDRRLYGKGKSIVSSLNIDVPTEALLGVWVILSCEVNRLELLAKYRASKEERA